MSDREGRHDERPPSPAPNETQPSGGKDPLGHDPEDGPALDGGSGLAIDDPAAEEEVGGGD